jgi:hypothetical protein
MRCRGRLCCSGRIPVAGSGVHLRTSIDRRPGRCEGGAHHGVSWSDDPRSGFWDSPTARNSATCGRMQMDHRRHRKSPSILRSTSYTAAHSCVSRHTPLARKRRIQGPGRAAARACAGTGLGGRRCGETPLSCPPTQTQHALIRAPITQRAQLLPVPLPKPLPRRRMHD